MMKKLGIKNFRMSLSWSRLLPNGTTKSGINGLGVSFYNMVIDELLAAGITPWVTLHHWDTPSALHNKTSTGSFLSRDITDSFADYADFVFAVYGDRVKHWLTLNEPWTYAVLGYGSGVNAPGRCSESRCVYTGGGGNTATEPYIAAHNLLIAHAKAAKLYKTKYQREQGGVIGLTANVDFAVPYNASNPDDVEAASRSMAFAFGWYVDPIVFGRYPPEMQEYVPDGRLPSFTPADSALLRGSYDFIGLNHYTSSYVGDNLNCTPTSWFNDSCTFSTRVGLDGKLIGPPAESPWLYVYPPGLRGILNWITKRYNSPTIYIFENGVSVPHENSLPIE
jgi:beta-glucosidase